MEAVVTNEADRGDAVRGLTGRGRVSHLLAAAGDRHGQVHVPNR
ncbi:hypothetical protein [Gleimia europaea]|nr:hypothetical protein [Gleimia europaea]